MPHVDLLELPYFEGISFDALVSFVDLMAPRTFNPGDIIVHEGAQDPPPLFIATQGKVRITKTGPGGVERPLAELDGPTLFGEIELFCQIPAVASAVALTRVHAFELTRLTFERLYEAHHPALMQFTYNVAKVACHRLAVADAIMAQMVDGDDLVAVRQAVFAEMRENANWSKTTGVFKRPGKAVD